MDVLFSEIKKKDVIDLSTGKRLGKVKDVLLGFPEGRVKAFCVSCGLFGGGDEREIKLSDVEKIGDDAIFVYACRRRDKKPCEDRERCDKGEPSNNMRCDKGEPCGRNEGLDGRDNRNPPPCAPPHLPERGGEENPLRFDDEDYE